MNNTQGKKKVTNLAVCFRRSPKPKFKRGDVKKKFENFYFVMYYTFDSKCLTDAVSGAFYFIFYKKVSEKTQIDI